MGGCQSVSCTASISVIPLQVESRGNTPSYDNERWPSGIRHGQLRPEDERRLKRNYSFILSEIDATQLTDVMFEKEIFAKEDIETIKSSVTTKDRNEAFMHRLFSSGPGESFQIFMDILQERYPHVSDRIKSS
ncbi:uncharacterized protein LOC131929154 [Physella acuta]|uniref:uncharacterized protein LOC131929154 n=1 Tax=Physella acuta TaxID=109671 RepID=UPI0027DD7C79|nr:uncharacterized protein LOC131929154 [Physella acuta]